MQIDDELNLPIIKREPAPPSLRSVDEINNWIEHDYKYFFNRKIYEKEKKANSVNVKFSLVK